MCGKHVKGWKKKIPHTSDDDEEEEEEEEEESRIVEEEEHAEWNHPAPSSSSSSSNSSFPLAFQMSPFASPFGPLPPLMTHSLRKDGLSFFFFLFLFLFCFGGIFWKT